MPDFSFLHNQQTDKWTIADPRRAKRPDVMRGKLSFCPFCPEHIGKEETRYEVKPIKSEIRDSNLDNWLIRVIPNKFPFAPIHEVIVLSPEHDARLESISFLHFEQIIQTYQQRCKTYEADGSAYIFHNSGQKGGESIPHPHSQLAVIPPHITHDIPPLVDPHILPMSHFQETDHFLLFCPEKSVWSDEVWVAPKKTHAYFREASSHELSDLGFVLSRLLTIYTLRYGGEFPYNFYLYPDQGWYLRLIPRIKTMGGFEIGTGIFVNTQDPRETIAFIKEHFTLPDEEKIRREYQASYPEHV